MEQIVVSLELAHRLKDGGFSQETVFVWFSPGLVPRVMLRDQAIHKGYKILIGAPTADEIFACLPTMTALIKLENGYMTTHDDDKDLASDVLANQNMDGKPSNTAGELWLRLNGQKVGSHNH